jgi:chemotaxis protein methyltransferase CheR
VLCRNTVIYFNEDVRDALHGRLARSLRSGGRLVVGGTERVAAPAAHGLEPELPFIYRKS